MNKSKLRKTDPIDCAVMSPKGLWWTDSGYFDFAHNGAWRWMMMMMMIMQPDHITPDMFQEALEQLDRKRSGQALSKLRLESFHEGPCVQIMHVVVVPFCSAVRPALIIFPENPLSLKLFQGPR